MLSKRSVLAAVGAAILFTVMVATPKGWEDARRTTFLTFNTPFALPGVALPPGTYIFELADPSRALDLVRVTNRDRSRVYLTAYTRLVRRPKGLRADRQVSWGEVRPGFTPPITAWYPIGEPVGHLFVYGDHSRQLLGRSGN